MPCLGWPLLAPLPCCCPLPCPHARGPGRPHHPLPRPRSAASAVELVDSKLPEGFELLEGATKASFAKLDVASKASHSYVVKVASAEGLQSFEPAAVTYKADADGEEQVRAALRGAVSSKQACGEAGHAARRLPVRPAVMGMKPPAP